MLRLVSPIYDSLWVYVPLQSTFDGCVFLLLSWSNCFISMTLFMDMSCKPPVEISIFLITFLRILYFFDNMVYLLKLPFWYFKQTQRYNLIIAFIRIFITNFKDNVDNLSEQSAFWNFCLIICISLIGLLANRAGFLDVWYTFFIWQ